MSRSTPVYLPEFISTQLVEGKYEAPLGKIKDADKSAKNNITMTATVWISVATEVYHLSLYRVRFIIASQKRPVKDTLGQPLLLGLRRLRKFL